MNQTMRQIRRCCLLSLLVAGPAFGEILDFSATVEARVEEFLGNMPTDTDEAFDSFPQGSSTNLPISVDTGFQRLDNSQNILAEGVASTVFNDPRVSSSASPEEFGLRTGAFSNDASLRYTTESIATETRQIVLTPENVALEAGTPVQVRSRFFVDGVLVLWSIGDRVDLSGVEAKMHLRVDLSGASPSSGTRLDTSVSAAGLANGAITLTTTGILSPDDLTTIDLSGLVEGLSSLQIVIIPNLAIPYVYETTVDSTFSLKAEIDCAAMNQPGGTGAAVVLGLSLEDLAALVSELTGEPIDSLLFDALASTNALASTSGVSSADEQGDVIIPLDTATSGRWVLPSCGPLGVESLLVGLGLCFAPCFLGRRHGFPSRRP